jgi:hypothetical protein
LFNKSNTKEMSANANIVVNIAVDAAQVYSTSPGMYKGNGIYMMDNNAANGSGNEGSLELNTSGSAGQTVAFNVFVINEEQNNGAQVQIEGMEQSNGTNVFGNQGWPKEQPAGGKYQFLGVLKYAGQMTYQIKIGVTTGTLFPIQYYTWDPFFTVES